MVAYFSSVRQQTGTSSSPQSSSQCVRLRWGWRVTGSDMNIAHCPGVVAFIWNGFCSICARKFLHFACVDQRLHTQENSGDLFFLAFVVSSFFTLRCFLSVQDHVTCPWFSKHDFCSYWHSPWFMVTSSLSCAQNTLAQTHIHTHWHFTLIQSHTHRTYTHTHA